MALSQAQLREVAAYWANDQYVQKQSTATFNSDDIRAAAGAIDNAFDTTLDDAVAAVGGTVKIINGLAAAIPQPFKSGTDQQKIMLACHVLMKRAGII